ncbi:MAG TPA: UrcA family protein [Sphingomicrobium sp.]|nr:UrcA family protein [Sphingomicrobium sp.]
MDVRQIACVLATGIVGGLLATAIAAPAKGQSYSQPVTVVGLETDPLTKHVFYGDLSLATSEGREILMHRVGQAINEACPIFNEQGLIYDAQDCRDFAWNGAHRQIKQAIISAKSGSAVAMAIKITVPH